MSKLVIVESPAKAKTIKKYLGKEFEVLASAGHVRDLPKSKIGIDVENDFTPKYVNLKDKAELIKTLKAASKESDFVYLATDPDREGEAISWHLAQLLGLKMDEDNRVVFNEITKTGVLNGMEQPRAIDLDLVDAQQARRVLDRLVGYKLSPFLWKKIKRGLSAGRVQSVALRLIVDREKEIRGFVPKEYWSLDAQFNKDKKKFIAKFHGSASGKKVELGSKEETDAVLSAIDGGDFNVQSVKKGKRNKQPSPPFTTSTLQQEASRKLNYNGQRTMRIAQQLYEGVDIPGYGTIGLITYMRTDSLRISEEARADANGYIIETFGENYLPASPRYFKTKKNAQDAHEAIRPTTVDLLPEKIKESLTAEQYKLYKLVWDRFMASLMAACIHDTVSVNIECNEYLFKASGYKVKFDGFTKLYVEGRDDDEEDSTVLPDISEGETLKLSKMIPAQHFTEPPARYTEPTIIKALDEFGIGRPSTYVPIISNITSKDYIEKIAKTLKPTPLGETVTDLMCDNFKDIVDIKFTAGMENDLDRIESGELNWKDTIKDFYTNFDKTLQEAEVKMDGQRVKVPDIETDEKCELCGKNLVIKSSRYGKFLACPGYPDCKFTKTIAPEIKGNCPVCGSNLIMRTTKTRHKFFGCSSYPECKFMTWNEPVGENCPQCGKTLFKEKGKLKCLTENCGFEKSAKKSKGSEDGDNK